MINLIQGFNIGSALPIDGRVLLSKEEMVNINDNVMPTKYFAICKEDGKIYLYDKNIEANNETGKFFKATPEKVSQLENDVNYDLKEEALSRESDLQGYVEDNFIDNEELETILANYSLVDETGNNIKLHWDPNEYSFSVELFDKNGESLSKTQEIDLPLKTMVVNARYNAATKEIILTLKNGNELKFSVADLISGLVSDTTFNAHVDNDVLHTNATERTNWNSKYDKPVDGIPANDLDANVNEKLGLAGTAIQQADLDENYFNKSEINSKLVDKQDNLVAGENININGTTISAVDTIYSAGTGINITNNVISATASAPTWESIEGADPKVNTALASELATYAKKDETEAELAKKALASDLSAHTSNSAIHVTDDKKAAWDAKYDKPAAGIPSVDMDSTVQASLAKADSALQEHQSLAEYRKSADQDLIDATKVNKVTGKGLSTNDYTNADKTKLAGIEEGAEVNIITGVSVNGIDAPIAGKKVTLNGLASGDDVDEIKAKIPTEASSVNKLADKDFVNSSIASATATFRGTVNSTAELKLLTGDLNDYAYIKVLDDVTGLVKQYDRYKYSDTVSQETGNWAFEYTLNNSSFTSEQWAAINSNITAALTEQITTNKEAIDTKVTIVASKDLLAKTEINRLSNMSTGANKTTVNNEGSGNIEIDGTSKNVYTHPSHDARQASFSKLTVDNEGHITGSTPVVANDITGLISYSAGSGLVDSVSGVNHTFSTTYANNIALQVADWQAKTDGTSEDVQYYYQTKSNINGINENSTPILDVVITKDDYANVDDINEAWSKIFSAETGNKSITFYATEAPEIMITVQAKCY